MKVLPNRNISYPLSIFSVLMLQAQLYFLSICYFKIFQRYLISSIFKRRSNRLVSKLLQRKKSKGKEIQQWNIICYPERLSKLHILMALEPRTQSLKNHVHSHAVSKFQLVTELHKEMSKY